MKLKTILITLIKCNLWFMRDTQIIIQIHSGNHSYYGLVSALFIFTFLNITFIKKYPEQVTEKLFMLANCNRPSTNIVPKIRQLVVSCGNEW